MTAPKKKAAKKAKRKATAKKVINTVVDILEVIVSPTPVRAAAKHIGRWIAEPHTWVGIRGANPEAIVDGKAAKSKRPKWHATGGGKWVWVAKPPKWASAVKTGEFKKGG